MCIQKKKKIEVSTIIFNVIFTIILVLSSCGLCNAQDDDDSFENEIQTGNVFVRFFKYGKHSILYNGLRVGTLRRGYHVFFYKERCSSVCCVRTAADVIMGLLGTRYEYRYNIKPSIGVYTSGSLFDGFSFFDFVSKKNCIYILNLNLGGTLTVLRKNNFSWRMYLGIGIMWGANFFYDLSIYDNYSNYNNLFSMKNDYETGKDKLSLFKAYFKNMPDNLKHFDIIIDVSAFDFIIKGHWRIALTWKAGVANFYNIIDLFRNVCDIKDNSFYFMRQKKTTFLGDSIINNLILSIGYQF